MSAISQRKLERMAGSAGAFIAPRDIAAMFAVSMKTVKRWVSDGTLPPADIVVNARVRRWRPSTIERWIEQKSSTAGEAGGSPNR